MFQIVKRIQTVCLRCFCDAVRDGTRMRSPHCVDEHPVLFSENERFDSALRRGVVNRHVSVSQEYPEVFLLIDAVVKPIRCFAAGKDRTIMKGRFYPREILLNERPDVLLPLVKAFFSRQSCQSFLQFVDRSDPLQGLVGCRCSDRRRVLRSDRFDGIRVIPPGVCLISDLE